MPHFVLIDHSVQDTTGHHYEYAMRVLEAAQEAGYTPVLGANLRFRPKTPPPFRVEAIYPDGFWPRMAANKKAWVVKGLQIARRAMTGLRYRFWFSRWGFLWLIRNEPFAYLRNHPFDAAVGGVFLVVVGAPVWLLLWLSGVVLSLIPFRKYWSTAAGSVWRPPVALAGRALNAISSHGAMADWRFARQKEKSFGLATLRLLRSLSLGPDDIVFVPTLAEPEMLGLLRTLGGHAQAALPAYHLLFRRDLYPERGGDFEAHAASILPVRNAFLRFQEAARGRKVYFYTDTEELSQQFNRLQIFPFRTCPIPHTAPAPPDAPPVEPLQITYLGDARAEKGYHLLPGMVHDLWRSEVRTGRVKFLFQSNYNVEPGEPEAIVARSQLSGFPEDKVRLVRSTCTSAEYRSILMTASLIVLPYRADLYAARSSGVLIEALAAGIPVVVPATSWLAKQIAAPAFRYVSELAERLSLPRQARRQWTCEGVSRTPAEYGSETLAVGGEDRKAYTWLTPPHDARALAVSFRFDAGPGRFVTCYADQLDAHGRRLTFSRDIVGPGYGDPTAAFVIRLHPQARRVWIALRNAFSADLLRIEDVSVRFLGADPDGAAFPVSAVGVTFAEPTSQGLTRAVREVLAHYDHYRATARANSESVYAFHNPGNLIRTIANAPAAQPAAKLLEMNAALI